MMTFCIVPKRHNTAFFIYKILNECPLITHYLWLVGRLGSSVNRFNHTSWVAVVKYCDCPSQVGPQSLCNQSFVVTFLCCHVAFLDFSVVVAAFVIRLSQISSFYSTCTNVYVHVLHVTYAKLCTNYNIMFKRKHNRSHVTRCLTASHSICVPACSRSVSPHSHSHIRDIPPAQNGGSET